MYVMKKSGMYVFSLLLRFSTCVCKEVSKCLIFIYYPNWIEGIYLKEILEKSKSHPQVSKFNSFVDVTLIKLSTYANPWATSRQGNIQK